MRLAIYDSEFLDAERRLIKVVVWADKKLMEKFLLFCEEHGLETRVDEHLAITITLDIKLISIMHIWLKEHGVIHKGQE